MTTTNDSNTTYHRNDSFGGKNHLAGPWVKLGLGFCLFAVVAGCQTQGPEFKPTQGTPVAGAVSGPAPEASEAIILRAGDVLKVSFPGSPNLDTVAPIRRDGKITLPLVNDVDAAGMTPDQLQESLLKAYASQLSTKEVTVSVESSSFPVYITGFVIHPGKISPNHSITALEAIMEAGGFDYAKADLKAVKVIRNENGVIKNYILNLKRVLDGQDNTPFYLKPADIVYVPERFSWY